MKQEVNLEELEFLITVLLILCCLDPAGTLFYCWLLPKLRNKLVPVIFHKYLFYMKTKLE